MDNLSDKQTELTPTELCSKSEEDEELDPRIPIEFERLNHANEAINHLELQLDEVRTTFKKFWETSEADLYQLEKSIGSAVVKAQSYYDTRIKLRDAKEILTKAKHRFERAQALHVAAKELAIVSADHIDEAEKSNQNATTWNETYRHAIAQATDAEREKYLADLEVQRAEKVYFELEKTLEKLQKDYRRSINKSKPYYERKAEYHKEFEFQKRKLIGLENCVNEAKSQYQQSLRNLEHISNEIHEQRNQGKQRKEPGEQTSNINEEQQLTYTETKTTISDSIPTLSQQANSPDNFLHSYLLRTESLPTGIFTKTNDQYSIENNETKNLIDHFNNQFILTSKHDSYPLILDHNRERLPSFSSQVSSLTDDDDKSNSLHVLSDEQLNNLAYEYNPYSQFSYETDPLEEVIAQIQNTNLQAKAFIRNLFKTKHK